MASTDNDRLIAALRTAKGAAGLTIADIADRIKEQTGVRPDEMKVWRLLTGATIPVKVSPLLGPLARALGLDPAALVLHALDLNGRPDHA